jgi:3D-(3,5/4)-trihydroxycyclohexane-1,2-dione acylhydrolase (decyclizing)
MNALTNLSYDSNYTSLVQAKEAGVEEEFIKATGGLITQTAAIGAIREHIEEDAIIVGASGSLPGDLQRMWTTQVKDTYHMEYAYSCMGYEIAATLGAKLAEPNRACYAMVGDGSFMMLHSEIATALQENKKITVLLFDNCGFGCINNLQMGKGIGSLATMFRYRDDVSNKQDGNLITTDFAMIGRGYGMTTYTAKTMEELILALEEAKDVDNSVLIDIKVLPKSMTDGYGSWWHVGIGDSNTNQNIKSAYEDKEKHLKEARMY